MPFQMNYTFNVFYNITVIASVIQVKHNIQASFNMLKYFPKNYIQPFQADSDHIYLDISLKYFPKNYIQPFQADSDHIYLDISS